MESRGLQITKNLLKELKQARMEGGYRTILFLSLKELLVNLIAHELRHHWQHTTPFRKGIWGSELERKKCRYICCKISQAMAKVIRYKICLF